MKLNETKWIWTHQRGTRYLGHIGLGRETIDLWTCGKDSCHATDVGCGGDWEGGAVYSDRYGARLFHAHDEVLMKNDPDTCRRLGMP